jgi:hypothetical protein
MSDRDAVGNGRLGRWCHTISINNEHERYAHKELSKVLLRPVQSADIQLDSIPQSQDKQHRKGDPLQTLVLEKLRFEFLHQCPQRVQAIQVGVVKERLRVWQKLKAA